MGTMHHNVPGVHGAHAGYGAALTLFLTALIVAAMAVHHWARCTSDRSATVGSPWSHTLMGTGMVYMLLPGRWQPVPLSAVQIMFVAAGAYSLLTAVGAWRTGVPAAFLCHADLVVGDAAMIAMLGPARLA